MATIVGTDGINLFYNSDPLGIQSVPLLSSGASQFGSYLVSVSNGATVAFNLKTGQQDIMSNTDAAVVIRAVIANMPAGGTIFFQNGVYNLNSLVQETTGGFSQYYAIGIPSGGPNQYFSWQFIGESPTSLQYIIGDNAVQSNGVIFNLTTTAENSVAAGSAIFNTWVRPDTVNNTGATVRFKNIDFRLPTNQRGSETALDTTQALTVDLEHVMADFNILITNSTFPVAGSHGLYGITSTASEKDENNWLNVYAVGFNVAFDIQSEHAVLQNCYAELSNYAINYGVRGPAQVYHPSNWISSGWGECAHGLTIGANCPAGSMLEITGLDIEDATASIFPAFQPVYHALETNSGNSWGRISYSRIQAGVGIVALSNLFDGGGGSNFTPVTYP